VRATAVTAQTSELVNIAPSADTDFGGAELFPATVAAAVAATSCEHATTTALATDLVDERTSANVPRGDPLAFGAGARLGAAAIAAIAAGEGVDRGVLVRLVAVGDVDVVAVRDVEVVAVRDVNVMPVRDVPVRAMTVMQVPATATATPFGGGCAGILGESFEVLGVLVAFISCGKRSDYRKQGERHKRVLHAHDCCVGTKCFSV